MRASLIVLGLTLFGAGPGLASGRLPPEPLPDRRFADFASCVAHLEERAGRDQEGVAAGAVPQPNGSTRQKLVQTKGVVKTAPEAAEYEAPVGISERATDRERGYIVSYFNYEDTRLICRGGHLSGTLVRGFATPGYEKLPDAPRP